VAAFTADGLTHPILSNAAPYDLLIANILAGPLTQLAPAIQKALAPGAVLLLSGCCITRKSWLPASMAMCAMSEHGAAAPGARWC
jgi:ribosomal protein L11 methyltransferase